MNNFEEKNIIIQKLLTSNEYLEEYISSIEKNIANPPKGFEKKLLSKFESISHTDKKTVSYSQFFENTFSILKIAACTFVCLIMWNSFSTYKTALPQCEKQNISMTEQNQSSYIKDKLKIANDFLLTPIRFERNDI